MGAFAVALLLLTPLQTATAQDPAAVVRQAIAAVEGDSADALQRRWSRTRRSTDRIAALGLATLARATYQDSIAHGHYRTALNVPTMDRTAGYAALGMSLLLDEREDWLRADSIIARSIAAGRALNDSSLLAEALITQGRVRISLAKVDSGLASIAEATALLRPTDYRLHAFARCTTGRAAAAQGDHRGALNHFLAGSDLAGRGKETGTRAWCDGAAGDEYTFLFRADSALLAFERALTGFRETHNRWGLASVLRSRSDHWRLAGALGRARRDAAEAVVHAEASRHFGFLAWSHVTLAQVALAVDDVPQAAAEVADAKRIFVRQRDEYGLAVAPALEANLALTRGDATAARAAFEESVANSRTGSRFGAVSAWTGLAWTALMANDSLAARVAVDSTLPLLAAAGMPVHSNPLSFLEGTMALRFGRLSDAERIFRARLAGLNPRQGSRYYVSAARLAETLARQGRLDEAETQLRSAAEQFDTWRQSVDDRQLRLLAYQTAADMSDPDLGVATVIAELARGGRIAAAFELVERGRARDLADRLNRAAAFDTTAGKRAARVGAVIGLDSAMRALPDESTAMLEYVTGRGDPTTLFVITRRQARAYVLASEDSLAPFVERLTALIESGEEPRVLARDLGRRVLTPALADLDPAVRRLVVIPDGSLNRLPFDVLVMPDDRFVLERFAVVSAPAASIAAHLWRRPTTSATRIAVLADPRFAGETRSVGSAELFRSAVSQGEGLPRLPGSRREARAVARYAGEVTLLRRARASESWLKNAPLDQYAVVHFATHALVDEGSLGNTALALAPDGSDDGFIRPSELADLSFAAELVVLSACRTASGAIVRGEGIQGLTSPLLAAGARAVAATRWPIGDLATLAMVDDFYREMATGQPAGDALHASKLAALKRGAPLREWAAFTLVGDPLARPPLRLPGPAALDWRIVLALMIVALAIYGLAMRSRRMREGRLPSGSTATTRHR